MLTTVDNPYDPFTEYEEWNNYDVSHGHHTASFLARIAYSAVELSEADRDLVMEQAIDEIVTENISGKYRKVREPKPESEVA
jgi:hypothetical protein